MSISILDSCNATRTEGGEKCIALHAWPWPAGPALAMTPFFSSALSPGSAYYSLRAIPWTMRLVGRREAGAIRLMLEPRAWNDVPQACRQVTAQLDS